MGLYIRYKVQVGNLPNTWRPNSIPLGSVLVSGASFFINGGAGVYLSMSGSADDAFYFNDSLNKSGLSYDGSDLALKIHCRLSQSGTVGDTVGLLLDYGFIRNGDNSTTTVTNVGCAITFACTICNGASFTINEKGIFAISYNEQDDGTAGQPVHGLSLNSCQLTTNVTCITAADKLIITSDSGGNQERPALAWIGHLCAGDVIRPHTNGGELNNTDDVSFTITKVNFLT